MQRLKRVILGISGIICALCVMMNADCLAQDEIIMLEHEDVFVELKRPSVEFPHMMHEDSLGDQGCGLCHHIFDQEKGTLVYSEGDEQACADCHGLKKEGKALALREAFHKSCTGCHRQMKKSGPEKTGPTTCGECHQKKSK